MRQKPCRSFHPRTVGLLGLLFLACFVTGCGESSDSTNTATSTQATAGAAANAPTVACRDAAALKASVTQLDQLDVPKAGRAGLQAAVQDVRSRLATLRESAGNQWAAQIAELDGAVQVFQTTVASVNSDNVLDDLPAKIRNLEQIDQAWTRLESEIDQTCPKA
jgi:hypothetical protein